MERKPGCWVARRWTERKEYLKEVEEAEKAGVKVAGRRTKEK